MLVKELIGHYRVVEPLGEGGMGAVYRARDERLDREVAIKLLKNQTDTRALERFFREARAASALNHPNIVTVFDAGEANTEQFIVMELVRGRSLRALIGPPVGLEQLRHLGRQMAEALAVAHEAGIVHHDIKPENIMVRDDGYIKILDFGLARLIRSASVTSDSQSTVPSESRTIAGTIQYMSPEQAIGQPVNAASDLFSLGIILYELATGQHPFQAEAGSAILRAILSHEPVPPARLNAELTGPLDTLMLRMLNKSPDERPSAREVTAALAMPTIEVSVPAVLGARVRPLNPVGRLRERAALRDALTDVSEGRGLLVCVSGEAGIGKSTLVEDFLAEDSDVRPPYRVARGRCSERLAGTEAYLPLLDALEDLLRCDNGELARVMKSVAPLWYEQVAPASQPAFSTNRVNERKGATQERFKRELVAFLQEASRHKSLILVFDDVHWVDVSTVDVLSYVSRRFDTLPVMIIATYRPEEFLIQKHPFLSTKQDLQGRGLCREIALEFLTRAAVEQYILQKFPDHRLPPSFVDLIHAKTEGNPLFVVAVLDYLCDQKVLSHGPDGWTLARSVPDLAQELPESVRGVIQRKIDLLDDVERKLLVAASVQGYEFNSAVVARAVGVDAADVEEQFDTLDRIRGFVRRLREEELPDGTVTLRYRFIHVLYQNALYASLTPARKIALSRAVGGALQEAHRNHTDDIASQLAVVFETARDFSRAAEHFQIAAIKAASVFAYEEALALGRRALKALLTMPDSPERGRRELGILMTMGLPATASKGYSSTEVEEIYGRASVLCVEFNLPEQLALTLWRLFAADCVRLRVDSAQVAANRLDELNRTVHDPRLAVQICLANGLVHHYRGDFETATEDFERALAGCTFDVRRSISATLWYDPAVAARTYLAFSYWCLGFPDKALEVGEAALRAAEEFPNPFMRVFALQWATTVHHWRGEWEQLKKYNDLTLEISSEQAFSYHAATSICFDGIYRAHCGDHETGVARLREGLARFRAMEGRASERLFRGHLSRLLALTGRPDEGLMLINMEIESARSDHYWDAELSRFRGEVLLIRGHDDDSAEAERCFQRARDIARLQRAKSLELRAATNLCRLWHKQGKKIQAIGLLTDTYAWFTEGFQTADLRSAEALLGTIKGEVTTQAQPER